MNFQSVRLVLILLICLMGRGVDLACASQQADLTDFFPRIMATTIGGTPRILVREFENPHAPLPQGNVDPFTYMDWKKANNIHYVNEMAYELEFSPQEGAWFRQGQKLNLRSFPYFSEGMRFIWTRDFRLLSGFGGNHATFDNGDYGLCAGTLHFDNDGLIANITNKTGHMCATQAQLLQMVADLTKMGAIAKYVRVADYHGKRISLDEVVDISKEIDTTNLRMVEVPASIEEAYQNKFRVTAERAPSDRLSMSQIIFEILDHDRQELFARGGAAGMHNRDEILLEKLIASRPHQAYYDQILAITSQAQRIDWQQNVVRGGGAMPFNNESEKIAAIQYLQKLIDSRPHAALYDEILGTPVIAEDLLALLK